MSRRDSLETFPESISFELNIVLTAYNERLVDRFQATSSVNRYISSFNKFTIVGAYVCSHRAVLFHCYWLFMKVRFVVRVSMVT